MCVWAKSSATSTHARRAQRKRRFGSTTTRLESRRAAAALGGLGLLRQEHRVNVRDDTARRDRHAAEQLVQLFVVADCVSHETRSERTKSISRNQTAFEFRSSDVVVVTSQLNVARHDAVLLVVARRVAGQLEDLGGEVLEHGGHVDRRAGANASRIAALAQVAVHTTDRELQACARAARTEPQANNGSRA